MTIYVVNLDNKNPHVSPKWPGKLFRKISVFHQGKYLWSSNAYSSLKKAKLGAAHERNKDIKEFKAVYHKQ